MNQTNSILRDPNLSSPTLRFTPTAWAKLHYFCHRGSTEIGGFGLASPDDLLLVEDLLTVSQRVSAVTVAFDDAAVADLFEDQVDQGHKPEQFARIWLHTHPGDSPVPSSVDEETFARVFGACDWAIMFILAKGGQTYARLRFNTGPGGQMLIPVSVEYRHSFPAADHDLWESEYQAHIHIEPATWRSAISDDLLIERRSFPDDWLGDLELMEPRERRLLMDELAARPDLWGDEGEVFHG